MHLKPYFVVWNVELNAEDEQDAAKRALEMQRDPRSIATVFEVYPGDSKVFGIVPAKGVVVDAEEEDV